MTTQVETAKKFIEIAGFQFEAIDLMYVVLAIIIFISFLFLYHLNKDKESSINIIDLVAINGRLNERKLTRFGAWVVSTWGFVYLITIDKLSEWYFVGYMGAWVANALIGKAIKDRDGEESPTKKE